jgi:hypothetical protein
MPDDFCGLEFGDDDEDGRVTNQAVELHSDRGLYQRTAPKAANSTTLWKEETT